MLLDHTIVPTRDAEASARFFATIFGLHYQGPDGHFAPVAINEDLTFDFANADSFEHHHYAFRVRRHEFEQTLKRVRAAGLAYGSGPRELNNSQIAKRSHGEAFYFRDPNGHILEVITAD